MLPQRSGIPAGAVALGDSMEEFAIAFVAVAILALAAFAVVVQPSLSFWQSDES